MKHTPRFLTLPSVELDSALVQKLSQSIQETDLFGKLSLKQVREISGHMSAVDVPEGDAIYIEGEPADYMSMLITGKLSVLKETDRGKTRQIAEISPGRSVGEMSMLDGLPHSATVVAAVESTVAILTREAMEKLISQEPQLGANLLRTLAETISIRLRKTNNVLAQYLD